MIYLTDINLNGNELQNAVLQPLATAPTTPKLGQIYCNSVTKKIMYYTGSEWQTVGVVVETSTTNGKIKVDGVEMTVYTLPTTSTSQLGGMIVGNGLTADSTGKVSVDTVDNLTSDDATKPLSAKQGKALSAAIEEISVEINGLGTGDMLKSNYDTNNNGIVDNAEKLGGNLPSYYAAATAIPTSLSQLTNDEQFIKNTVNNLTNYYTKSETFTKTEVNALISNLATIQISAVDTLPATGASNIIYLVPKANSSTNNAKDEYIWTGTAFEKIGDTEIDLTSYLKKSEVSAVATTGKYSDLLERPTLLASKTLTLTAGQTAATASEPNFAGYIGAYNSTTGEGLLCDWKYASNTLTVEINSAQSYNITIIYNVKVS